MTEKLLSLDALQAIEFDLDTHLTENHHTIDDTAFGHIGIHNYTDDASEAPRRVESLLRNTSGIPEAEAFYGDAIDYDERMESGRDGTEFPFGHHSAQQMIKYLDGMLERATSAGLPADCQADS